VGVCLDAIGKGNLVLGGLAAYILGSIAALVTVLYEDMACIRI